MKLPIDFVPGTQPPTFTWRTAVTTPNGMKMVDTVGRVSVSVEAALLDLIRLAKSQARRIEELIEQNEELREQQAENVTTFEKTPPPPTPPAPSTPVKKGK